VAPFSDHVWKQVKAVTREEFESALKRDGYVLDTRSKQGAILVYWRSHDGRRVTVHFHSHQGFSRHRLGEMLKDAGWTTDEDLRRVRLVK
jgi:predicted RNA binding protein YcfA (HicA-like mRNA interferase family)